MEYPKNLDQAIEELINNIENIDLFMLKEKKKEDLIELHFSLGRWIRNNFMFSAPDKGLKLRQSLRDKNHYDYEDPCPDDTSFRIIKELHKRVQEMEIVLTEEEKEEVAKIKKELEEYYKTIVRSQTLKGDVRK